VIQAKRMARKTRNDAWRERVGLYGGTLEAGSAGSGFRVRATLALEEPA
jgi:hypothetical protein